MQPLDLLCKPSLDPSVPDPSLMSEQNSSPIRSSNAENSETLVESSSKNENNGRKKNSSKNNGDIGSSNEVFRRERPSRACTQRAAERMQAAARAEAEVEAERKRKKSTRKQKLASRLLKEEDSEGDYEEEGSDDVGDEDNADEDDGEARASAEITPLVGDLEDSQLPRWNIRSMWEMASVLNFLNVFRPLLNINVEFSAEELETALLTPNNTLAVIHIPLLKAIPPIIRMSHGPSTWITVLCKKLRDWWHWVAEGDLPIIASHGAEIEAYNSLDPGVRVAILKALCDIRVEQEDIKAFIDDSIKNGAQLSLFRKQRIGGDSRGVSYWYEDDPIIGHRLYREIRRVEAKRGKGKSVPQIPHSSYQWEAIATNLDEFLDVSEKLISSKNRTEASVGKKLKNDMIPEIEKVHKKKERLLKKQHREALMLDSIMHIDGLGGGRSLRDRKPVTYTFDDFDRSINEALKFNKSRQQSPEPHERGGDPHLRAENSFNGGWGGTLRSTRLENFSAPSPMSEDEEDEEMLEDHETEIFDDQRDEEALDRGNRRRQRPQRYAENEFTDGISDNEADPESDDDIVGEVVYDEEYLRKRKRRRRASSSEDGDEEYKWDGEENPEEEEEEEEEEGGNSLSTSEEEEEEDSDEEPRGSRKLRPRTRQGTRSRPVKEKTRTGLRRSERSTRNRVNYKLYEMSESDNELMKPEKSAAEVSEENGDEEEGQYSLRGFDEEKSYEHEEETNTEVLEEKEPVNKGETENENPQENVEEEEEDEDREDEGLMGGRRRRRRFLDLNELAPGNGFDDGDDSTGDGGPIGGF